MKAELIQIFERDLQRLHNEIDSYSNEENLWIKRGDISNSGGNLALHLCGNLQHFIGAILGRTGYVRNREEEFTKICSRSEILNEIEKTRDAVISTLVQLPLENSGEQYPVEVFGSPMTVEFFLIHLSGHLNYHLGQISYHRRILQEK